MIGLATKTTARARHAVLSFIHFNGANLLTVPDHLNGPLWNPDAGMRVLQVYALLVERGVHRTTGTEAAAVALSVALVDVAVVVVEIIEGELVAPAAGAIAALLGVPR